MALRKHRSELISSYAKWIWGAIVIAIGIFAYFHLSKRSRPIISPSTKKEQTITPQSLKKTKIKPSKKLSEKQKKTKNPPSLDDELVAFKVDDGLAIAFGDIMLGEVEEGVDIQEGYYKPLPPRLWEDSEIPYDIDDDLPNPQRVKQAIEYFNENTPIKFVPFEGQEDALAFVPGDENCYSYLGRIGGHQPIRLAANCRWNQIAHEIMHALGFIHEHSRTDRDLYVEVIWENIGEGHEMQFTMVPDALMETVKGWEFDFSSIMLYRPTAFSDRPGLVTLRAKGGNTLAPTNQGLSQLDLERLRDLYGE